MFFSCEKKCAILTEPEWLADQHGEWFIFIIYRITMIAWLDRRIYWSPLTKRRSYLRAWKTGTDKLFSYINFTSISLCFWIQYLFVILYAIQWLNELINKVYICMKLFADFTMVCAKIPLSIRLTWQINFLQFFVIYEDIISVLCSM